VRARVPSSWTFRCSYSFRRAPCFGGYVGELDPDADVKWLHTDEFRVPFNY
jgi:hypothetical protein